MDKDTYRKAYHLSKQNPFSSVYVLYDGDFRVEFVDSAGMGVCGLVDVAELVDGEIVWESKDF